MLLKRIDWQALQGKPEDASEWVQLELSFLTAEQFKFSHCRAI
jgi:hypothetical protein